jgi:hypothetical protein
MELQPVISGVVDDIEGLAQLGGEEGAALARRYAEAIGPLLRLRLYELLAQAALEVSASLPSGHVEVRLAGQEPTLVFSDPQADTTAIGGEELSARITLRLPEALKDAVDRAADREDLSVNSWLLRAIKRAVDRDVPSGRPGRRLSGYGRS